MSLYKTLIHRKRTLLLLTALALAILGALFSRIRVQESIEGMLPDRGAHVVEDFQLLAQSPFAQKVFVNLQTEGAPTPERVDALVRTARVLAAGMAAPSFRRAVSGPADLEKAAGAPAQKQGRESSGSFGSKMFFQTLIDNLPNLLSHENLKEIQENLTSNAVADSLKQAKLKLLTPEGWGMKSLMQHDPLELRSMALEKFTYLNIAPKTTVYKGVFLSPDRKNALIIADAAARMTDFKAAQILERQFQALVADIVPPGIKASIICGHLYTLANARAVKQDLGLVLLCSSLGLACIFLVFFRTRGGVMVLLIPGAAILAGGAAAAVIFGEVSGITLGFGAVVMGLSVDYGLHVYYTLRHGRGAPAELLRQVARPVCFGALTTIAAFSVLLTSSLPGQRQLAVFSIAGLLAAWGFSLVILPLFVKPSGKAGNKNAVALPQAPGRGRRVVVLTLWAVLLLGGGVLAQNVAFSGELRSLGVRPAPLLQTERLMRETWGDVRGRAVLFAQGDAPEHTLDVNSRLFTLLKEQGARDIVSLAPLAPGPQLQASRRADWLKFWKARRPSFQPLFEREAEALGFAPRAFAPFFHSLERAPAPINLEDLRGLGLGEVVDMLVPVTEGGRRIITLAADTPELTDLRVRGELPQNVRLVAQSVFADELSAALKQDFTRFALLAGGMVLALLLVLFRNPRKMLLALSPVLTGLATLFGGMALLGLQCNIYNILASILVMGLGVDYGIFMLIRLTGGQGEQGEGDARHTHATEKAVLVSGMTTVAGFGALVLASHPALHSIGVTVLLGLSGAIPAALVGMPCLVKRTTKE